MAVQKPPVIRVQIPAASFGVGRRSPISQISEHHIVGDSQAVLTKALQQQFSCTYTIALDGRIFQLVEDSDTPYTDNDYRSNGRSITIEHAGGGSYPYTEAMYQSSIKLHAWLFQTYGNLNCVRHRDIPEIKADPAKATACPGDLQVERIVSEARELLNKGEQEMITSGDVGILRIGHSEIGGWPMHETHAGKYDKLFLDVWNGHDVKEFIWAQWNDKQAQDFRAKREAAFAAAIELSTRPTQENYNKLNEAVKACQAAEVAATEKVRVLESEKAADTQAADGFLRRLGSFIKKYLP